MVDSKINSKYLHKQKNTNKSNRNGQLTQKDAVHFANEACASIKMLQSNANKNIMCGKITCILNICMDGTTWANEDCHSIWIIRLQKDIWHLYANY